jgi:hypothetical protein
MCQIDWVAMGTTISSIATILLVIIAQRQLSKMNEIAMMDFAHRLKNDFFTSEARTLFTLFENNLIIYKKDKNTEPFEVFEVIESPVLKNVNLPFHITKQRYSAYEIDDILLMHFEDVGLIYKIQFNKGMKWFNKHKCKTLLKILYEGFSYYVDVMHENDQVKKYIEASRSISSGADIYSNFDFIYNEFKKYREIKE